jgi:hypothetical protein
MLTFPNFMNMFPGAPGNWQAIDTRWGSPNVSVRFAGNPTVEREVTEDVASYGRQIGWLSEIVLALVEIEGRDAIAHHATAVDSFQKLRDARNRIEAIKDRRRDSAVEHARGALANLAATDRDAYAQLVQSLRADDPPAAA